jgi:aldehyde dehydrogenase (NAD+)
MADTFKNFIGGEWVAASTGETFPNVNPADTRDIVGIFQRSGAEDARRAVEAAKLAQPKWAAIPAPKRGEILFKAANLLEARAESVAREMTREEGKTLPEAKG